MKTYCILLILLLSGSLDTYAQLQRSTTLTGAQGKGTILIFPRGIRQSSGDVYYLLVTDTGRNSSMLSLLVNKCYDTSVRPIVPRKPFLKVHGNIMYDYYYQSGVDSPYLQKDIYQHTIQTYLDITIRDKYPVRLAFSTARGNATLFRNITGINLQYTNRDFRNLLLDKIQHWDAMRQAQLNELQNEKLALESKAMEVNNLRGWLTSPAQLQRLVEERERKLLGKPRDSLPSFPSVSYGSLVSQLPSVSSLPSASSVSSSPNLSDLRLSLKYKINPREAARKDTGYAVQYAERQHKLDSLQQQLQVLDSAYRAHQMQVGSVKREMVEKLMSSRNNAELSAQLDKMNLPDTLLPKGYKVLLAIRSFSIGRAPADYSELTVKGISIQGIQAAYNPSYYVGIAAGTIDYRFRNYVVNSNAPRQFVALIRGGYGQKESNHLYVTWYMGKKQLYNLNTSDSTVKPDYHIMGLAVEGRWQLGRNVSLTGEVAKSSFPYYQLQDEAHKVNSIFHFSDHRNEAYSLAANAFIPYTRTKVTGMYKVMGTGFQSFSLFTTGSKQIAWSVRLDQPFFKDQLLVTAGIRRNDYNSQYQQANYQSNSIFKSLQATLRIKHYPVLSFGYSPSSQLTKLSDGTFQENTFYTLIGTVSYFYKMKAVMMNTLLSYTRFYNKQDDSSFVYYNTKNILLNHTMFIGRFTVQGTGSAAMNGDYDLFGADGNIQYKVKSWLDIGGGIKYCFQSSYNLRELGYSANFRITIPFVGRIEMMMDNGFIPGVEKRLISNNTGRLTYTKTF